MTQDLNLGNNQIIGLTPDDSNLNTSFNLPKSISSNIAYNTECNSTDCFFKSPTLGGYYRHYTAKAGREGSLEDICAKGWKLPSRSDYSSLYSAYSNNGYALLNGVPNFNLMKGCIPCSQEFQYPSPTSSLYLTSDACSGDCRLFYINVNGGVNFQWGSSYTNLNPMRCILK